MAHKGSEKHKTDKSKNNNKREQELCHVKKGQQ